MSYYKASAFRQRLFTEIQDMTRKASANYPPKKSKSDRSCRQQNYEARMVKFSGAETYAIMNDVPVVAKANIKPIAPRTESQSVYMDAIKNNQLVFGIGPAGTGKTYCAVMLACEALERKEIDKIYLSRPAEQAGEDFGFLPGTLEEKYSPYLRPFEDIFQYKLGKSYFEYLLKSGVIEPRPLAFLRGTTLDRAWILLDEAQNTSPSQMEMFLTRLGDNCKAVVSGDLRQSDKTGVSGLMDALTTIKHLKGVQVVQFGMEDIVRGGLCQQIVYSYAERLENTYQEPALELVSNGYGRAAVLR